MPCRLVTKISFSSSTCKWKRGPMFWINLLQVSISLAPGPPMLAFTLSCNLLPIYRTRLRENNNKKETFSWLCSIEPLGVQWPRLCLHYLKGFVPQCLKVVCWRTWCEELYGEARCLNWPGPTLNGKALSLQATLWKDWIAEDSFSNTLVSDGCESHTLHGCGPYTLPPEHGRPDLHLSLISPPARTLSLLTLHFRWTVAGVRVFCSARSSNHAEALAFNSVMEE